ncbi:MAG: hypothetical protein ACI4Q9_03495 [Candidatus Methanomethylophilaceae archaeon]
MKDRLVWSAERIASKTRGLTGRSGHDVAEESVNYTLQDDAPVPGTATEPEDVCGELPETEEGTECPVPGTVSADAPSQPDTSDAVTEDAAHGPDAPGVRPIAMPKRKNDFQRTAKAYIRRIDTKRSPPGLFLVGTVALVFASLYLMRLFTSLDGIQSDMGIFKRIVSCGMLLFVFYQYVSYVITIFQLKSGMRGSWASMMRSSGSYVILMLLAETHLFDWLPFNLVAFPSWALLLCMVLVMLYMLMPFVREYYKPTYEKMVPLKEWILFIFWNDPYAMTDSPDVSIDADVDIPS